MAFLNIAEVCCESSVPNDAEHVKWTSNTCNFGFGTFWIFIFSFGGFFWQHLYASLDTDWTSTSLFMFSKENIVCFLNKEE